MKTMMRDIFLKQMLNILDNYLIFTNIFHFYQKEKKINKCKKLICSIESKEKYLAHIRALKQALNHGLKLKKVHRVIQFNQRAWLFSYINMNTKLRKDAKNDFEKDFYKLLNSSVFGKTMENVRNYRY